MYRGLLTTGLLSLLLLLMAFQCGQQKWREFVRDYKIQVNPSTIDIQDDTLRFHILIDATKKTFGSDRKQVFVLFVKGNHVDKKIEELTLPKERLIDREVVCFLDSSGRIESLDLRFNEYKDGKLRLVSPDLQIATIKDMR